MKKGACSAFFLCKNITISKLFIFIKKDKYELRILQCTSYKRGLN